MQLFEVQPMFRWSTHMALYPESEGRLFRRLVHAYKWQLLRSAPRHYLDKSHPNIWIAEHLKAAFPHSRFIGIERNPYATVASMIRHNGVSQWHSRWREFPIEPVSGYHSRLSGDLRSDSVASQCAMRWVAHHNRMDFLKGALGDSLKVIL